MLLTSSWLSRVFPRLRGLAFTSLNRREVRQELLPTKSMSCLVRIFSEGPPFSLQNWHSLREPWRKINVQKSLMGTPILAQKSGHGACVASLTAEKQPFPLKSGVRVASVTVTKMGLPVYENRCFFWILMPRGCPGAPD